MHLFSSNKCYHYNRKVYLQIFGFLLYSLKISKWKKKSLNAQACWNHKPLLDTKKSSFYILNHWWVTTYCLVCCLKHSSFQWKGNKEKIKWVIMDGWGKGDYKAWNLSCWHKFKTLSFNYFLESRNIVILKLIFCENSGKTSIKWFLSKDSSFTRGKNFLADYFFIDSSVYGPKINFRGPCLRLCYTGIMAGILAITSSNLTCGNGSRYTLATKL